MKIHANIINKFLFIHLFKFLFNVLYNNIENNSCFNIALFLENIEYELKEILNSNINKSVVHVMNFIHKKGMMHRDLKIENIMTNEFFKTKIVNFGIVLHAIFRNNL